MPYKRNDLEQTGRLVYAKRDVHVLHGRTRGALAEVVKQRRNRGVLVVAAYHNVELVRSRKLVGIERGLRRVEGTNAHEPLSSIVPLQARMHVARRGRTHEQSVVQHDGRSHTLVVIVDHRHEHGWLLKPAHLLHLGQMLVPQAQAI